MWNNTTIPYRANGRKLTQLFISGLVAFFTMTLFNYIGLALGMAGPDLAGEYGAILRGASNPPAFTWLWWTGLGIHAVATTLLFPLFYDYLAHKRILPNARQIKGVLYGTLLWVIGGMATAPLAGEGFFFTNLATPASTALTSLVGWILYGVVLDGMTRVRTVHYLHLVDYERHVA